MERKNTEDYEKDRNRQVAGMRSGLDYVMGFVFMIIGGIVIYKYQPDASMIAFGAVAILYGVWRIYKGYKKNYGQ